MKQGMRFLVRPGTFFNQLQWSTHHWIILLSFLVIAAIETHVGRQQAFYQVFADLVVERTGMSWDFSMWLVTVAKLTVMLCGAFSVASAVWFVGNLFGRRTSKRVLFRRLAVVFTVLLAAYTAQHLVDPIPFFVMAAPVLYAWALILAYFAIREQFALNHVETLVMGLFALLLVSSSWHVSNHVMETAARQALVELAKKTSTHNRYDNRR